MTSLARRPIAVCRGGMRRWRRVGLVCGEESTGIDGGGRSQCSWSHAMFFIGRCWFFYYCQSKSAHGSCALQAPSCCDRAHDSGFVLGSCWILWAKLWSMSAMLDAYTKRWCQTLEQYQRPVCAANFTSLQVRSLDKLRTTTPNTIGLSMDRERQQVSATLNANDSNTQDFSG